MGLGDAAVPVDLGVIPDSPQQTVRLLNFKTDKVTQLMTLEKQVQWGVPSLALSRDGRYVLAVQLDHAVNDFMMIENFR